MVRRNDLMAFKDIQYDMHGVWFTKEPQYVHSWIVYGEALINRHAYGSEVGQRQICVGCLNDKAGAFEGFASC